MSKIGKKPVVIGERVTVNLGENSIEVRGEGVAFFLPILPGIKVEQEENKLIFIPQNSTKETLSNWGTMRALTENAISGATKDFTKTLIIEGVGYGANVEGQKIVLNLVFFRPV